MRDWPIRGGNRTLTLNADAGSSGAGSTTSISGANAWSAWTELTSALSYPIAGFFVDYRASSTVVGTGIFELGVGAAGSEVGILQVPYTRSGSFNMGGRDFLPLRIAQGQRVAVRNRYSGADCALAFELVGVAAGMDGASYFRAVAYGLNISNSAATTLAHSGTVNVKGAWTELVASCEAHNAVILMLPGDLTDTNSSKGLIDVGIGPAGSEVVIIANVAVSRFAARSGPSAHFLPISLPSGSRLAARGQTDSSTRTNTIALIGLT